MNCKRCNKKIKNPKSVRHGYGPVCWIKIQKDDGIESKTKIEKKEHQPWVITHGRVMIL